VTEPSSSRLSCAHPAPHEPCHLLLWEIWLESAALPTQTIDEAMWHLGLSTVLAHSLDLAGCKNFSSGRLLDLGIWMTLEDTEQSSFAEFEPAEHDCLRKTKPNAQGPQRCTSGATPHEDRCRGLPFLFPVVVRGARLMKPAVLSRQEHKSQTG
jgi:hypothetical protein